MNIIVTINNLEVNFTQVVGLTSDLISLLATHNSLFKTIRYYEDPSSKMIEVTEFSKSLIEQSYLRSMAQYLPIPQDPDSSNIGYSTRFHGLTNSNSKTEIALSLGTKPIAGNDNILIRIEDDFFKDDFISKLNLIFKLVKDIIILTKPIKIVVQNYEIVNSLKDNPERNFGFIAFYSNNLFKPDELDRVGANFEVINDGVLIRVYHEGKEKGIEKLLKLKTIRELRKQQIN